MTETIPAVVPELGPLLGRLLEPSEPVALLETLRVEMLNELFDAAGRARTAARREGDAAARATLAHPVWLTAYGRAAEAAASRTADEIDRRLRDAARLSRMPSRLLARRLLSDEDRRVLQHRLAAAGIPLERTPPPEAAEPWLGGLRRSAAALEHSWERLVRFVRDELARGSVLVRAVAEWRRPRAPLWGITGLVVVLALTLGLMLGGYLPAPDPLATLRALWWSLPWP